MADLNNYIYESHCSFELSKLLKEKGFEFAKKFAAPYYNHLGVFGGDCTLLISAKVNQVDTTPFETIPAPPHALAVEWIRVNFGIWISVAVESTGYRGHYAINHVGNLSVNTKMGWVGKKDSLIAFSTPQEATEETLMYVVQKLLK